MNNSDILGEEAAVRQLVSGDFSATNGVFEDDSVTTIRNYGFRNATNLKSVYFPNVTRVGGKAFQTCSNLESVDLPKVTSFGSDSIFSFCPKIKYLNVPKTITIENSGNGFIRSQHLSELILPSFRGNLGGFCEGCSSLEILDFSNPLTITGQFCFRDCISLIALVLRRTDAICELNNVSAFNNTRYAINGIGNAYVYVPQNLISSYQTATNWSTLYAEHSDMFRALEDYTVDGTVTGEFDWTKVDTPAPTPIYTLENQEFISSTPIIDTGIQPFTTLTPELTILLDFTMNLQGTNGIITCYDNGGLRIRKNMTSTNIIAGYQRFGGSSFRSQSFTRSYGERGIIVLVIKNGTVYIISFKNNTFDASYNYIEGAPTATNNTTIKINDGFVGTIHNLRIYNTALDIRQIKRELNFQGDV